MNRVYFATGESAGEATSAKAKPRLAVFVEMAGGYAAASLDKQQLGESVKRAELLRGFERALPDGSTLRVQAFTMAPKVAPLPPEPKSEPKVRTKKEIFQAISEGKAGIPGVANPDDAAELPLFKPPPFEPYRVRAWLDGRELREVVGEAGRQDARIAMAILLLVGISETILGARIFPFDGFTRLLFTGPVFLLGALGVWKRWKWSVTLGLVVAIADTLIFVVKAAQDNNMGAFLLTVASRMVLVMALSRLRKSGW